MLLRAGAGTGVSQASSDGELRAAQFREDSTLWDKGEKDTKQEGKNHDESEAILLSEEKSGNGQRLRRRFLLGCENRGAMPHDYRTRRHQLL
jgi:hypothetical protein